MLASRKSAGIRVMLLWAVDTDTVAVLVCDDCPKEHFELVVEPEANPIDIYEHPYPYLSARLHGSHLFLRYRLERASSRGSGPQMHSPRRKPRALSPFWRRPPRSRG
jgi:hypothetical protein